MARASSTFHSAFMLRWFCVGFVWKPASLRAEGISEKLCTKLREPFGVVETERQDDVP